MPHRSSTSRAARRGLPRRLGLAAAAVLLTLLPGAPPARADAIDPSMPRVLIVGAPKGPAPSARLDAARTGRSRTRLPFPPVELWRRHVNGGIEFGPLVDEEGNVLVALTVPEVIKLSPDDRELWHPRLGAAAAVAPPVLTSDGTMVVLTSAGQAVGLSPSMSIRFTTTLGLRGRDAETEPLALRDGGLVVAAGRALVELDADGAVRARTSLDDLVMGSLLAGPEGTLVTTASGGVYTWHPPGSPRKLGAFGGALAPRRGAALADGRTLLAVIDNRRLMALDLPSGTAHVRASVLPGLLFDGPVALTDTGLTLTALQAGLLLGVDAAGNEKLHVALEKVYPGAAVTGATGSGATSFGAVSFLPPEAKPSPPVVVDAGGRVAFARAGGRVGVVGPDGHVAVATERLCAAPLAVTPAGDGKMVVACRDGTIVLFGE